jgi:hypothetical protein
MADDERTADETGETPEVEGHGAKHVVAGGLAAAALVGGTAAAVKLTDDGSGSRDQGALVTPEREKLGDLRVADRDKDGYVSYGELAHEGFKFNVTGLNKEGIGVTAAALSSAGFKLSLELVDKERGFAADGGEIFLKLGVDEQLDKLAQGEALEWTDKHRSVDRDSDGYATADELAHEGIKYNVAELNEAGYKFGPEELAKAGYKTPLSALGAGGFEIKGESVMLKENVDPALDELLSKW